MLDVVCTTRFTDRVHGKLRVTEVKGSHAHLCREHRSDGAATRAIVSHHKELKRHARLLGDFLQEDDARGVCRVSLVCVDYSQVNMPQIRQSMDNSKGIVCGLLLMTVPLFISGWWFDSYFCW